MAVPSDGFDGMAICCAYVPENPGAVTVTGLRGALAKLVPPYMLPSRWQSLTELPKNTNGKIDRPRLRDVFGEVGARVG